MELAIVMPVYNEEGAIEKVLLNWIATLRKLNIDARIHVYNDGSKDRTYSILDSIARREPLVIPHHKENSGHGPTILHGYREQMNVQWIFQVDSDDEMGPENFETLWSKRNDFDFLICSRQGRDSSPIRKMITFSAFLLVRILYGSGVSDVNSPYRLMRTEQFRTIFSRIPEGTFAPNVVITGFACHRKLRIFQGAVNFKERQTGEVSIKKWKLVRAALCSFWQSIHLRFKVI